MHLFKHKLDDPRFREEFCLGVQRERGIGLRGTIPTGLLIPNEGVTLVSNYPGREGDGIATFYVLPAIEAIVVAAYYLSTVWEDCRVLGSGREGALRDLNPEDQETLEPVLVPLVKKDGQYVLKHGTLHGMRIGRHIKRGGVFWSAMGKTTDRNGLNMDLDPRVIAASYKYDTHLGLLAIATKEHTGEMRAESIMFDELVKPDVDVNESELPDGVTKEMVYDIANRQVGLRALATIAAMLPLDQRGDFRDPNITFQSVTAALMGLASIPGVSINGGFFKPFGSAPAVVVQTA